MNPRKGRLLAWGSVVVGMVVLLVGVIAFKDRIAEEYWLHKLQSGDLEEQKMAAERLGEMGSVRAMTAMLLMLRGTDEEELDQLVRLYGSIGYRRQVPLLSDVPMLGGLFEEGMRPPTSTAFLLEALPKITRRSGRACVPYLANSLENDSWHIRCIVAALLGTVGLEARAAVPALTTALGDENESVRHTAAEALKKIKGDEGTEK